MLSMPRFFPILLALAVPCALVSGCGGGGGSAAADEDEQTSGDESTDESMDESMDDAETDAGLDGTYANADGAVLVITNVVPGTSFAFALETPSAEDGDDDPCGGVSYTGTAQLSEDGTATSEHEDSFRLDGGTVHLEPSAEMVGMECTTRFDADFTRR